MPLTPLSCPMFQTPCRHCSKETTLRSYTTLTKDPLTHLFKNGIAGKNHVILGYFCNDAGKWVSDMHYCPIMWAKSRFPLVAPVKKRGRPKKRCI